MASVEQGVLIELFPILIIIGILGYLFSGLGNFEIVTILKVRKFMVITNKRMDEKANVFFNASFVLMILGAISTITSADYLTMFFVTLAFCTGILAVVIGLKSKRKASQLAISLLWSGICFFVLVYGFKSYYSNRLVVAIGNGDIKKINVLISKGYNVNGDTGGGQNMLTWAFWYPYPNKKILSDQPLKTMSPETREKKIEEVLTILLNAGADPNNLDSHGQCPVNYAVSNKQRNVVNMLLKRGANINLRNVHGDTPLIVAVEVNDIGIVTILIQGGANINIKNAQGKTPLQLAIDNGYTQIAELLRQHGAKE